LARILRLHLFWDGSSSIYHEVLQSLLTLGAGVLWKINSEGVGYVQFHVKIGSLKKLKRCDGKVESLCM
jgi:hypothetical protein